MIMVKLNGRGRESVLAICDADLLGKRFSSGKKFLDLEKYGAFYDGDSLDERDSGTKALIRKLLSSAASANVVGKKSITLIADLGHDTRSARIVGGVLHLQIYRM